MLRTRALRPMLVVWATAAAIAAPVPADATERVLPDDASAVHPGSMLVNHHGVASRGDRGDRRRSAERGQAEPEAPSEQSERPDDCPTEMWTLPIELKGVLCVLVLEKHEEKPPAPSE